MKLYLKSIVRQLKNYSLSLDKTSILINKPWAIIDEEFEMQKLIFKNNNKLVISKNGVVQEGTWEYFPESRSLLIDRNRDKILCNEVFIDGGVMILKLDGTDNMYFTLANENIVPDLNVDRYLKELKYHKLCTAKVKLGDGRNLEVARKNVHIQPRVGDPVSINAEPVENGKYSVKDDNEYEDDNEYSLSTKLKYFEVENGRISKILTEKQYISPQGNEILIRQQENWRISPGDYVFVSGEKPKEHRIALSKTEDVIIEDGRVVELIDRNTFEDWLSEKWNALVEYLRK
jgi:hypothetical protein